MDRGLHTDAGVEDAAAAAVGGHGPDRSYGISEVAGSRRAAEVQARAVDEAMTLALVGGGEVAETARRCRRTVAASTASTSAFILVAVALHATAEHGAVEHVERGEQGGGAVRTSRASSSRPCRARRAGPAGRSTAWIWLFSSTDSTTACRGGAR